jgi:hypothetical protein
VSLLSGMCFPFFDMCWSSKYISEPQSLQW